MRSRRCCASPCLAPRSRSPQRAVRLADHERLPRDGSRRLQRRRRPRSLAGRGTRDGGAPCRCAAAVELRGARHPDRVAQLLFVSPDHKGFATMALHVAARDPRRDTRRGGPAPEIDWASPLLGHRRTSHASNSTRSRWRRFLRRCRAARRRPDEEPAGEHELPPVRPEPTLLIPSYTPPSQTVTRAWRRPH